MQFILTPGRTYRRPFYCVSTRPSKHTALQSADVERAANEFRCQTMCFSRIVLLVAATKPTRWAAVSSTCVLPGILAMALQVDIWVLSEPTRIECSQLLTIDV
jgi:hypothetical protein